MLAPARCWKTTARVRTQTKLNEVSWHLERVRTHLGEQLRLAPYCSSGSALPSPVSCSSRSRACLPDIGLSRWYIAALFWQPSAAQSS
jgi:hypothetical protein